MVSDLFEKFVLFCLKAKFKFKRESKQKIITRLINTLELEKHKPNIPRLINLFRPKGSLFFKQKNFMVNLNLLPQSSAESTSYLKLKFFFLSLKITKQKKRISEKNETLVH